MGREQSSGLDKARLGISQTPTPEVTRVERNYDEQTAQKIFAEHP